MLDLVGLLTSLQLADTADIRNDLSQTFSPDSRWLVVTSMDSIIRTFDIPTGQLIDAFKTASVCTSISFSPTGDFLATSHVDSVGVYLWYGLCLLATELPISLLSAKL